MANSAGFQSVPTIASSQPTRLVASLRVLLAFGPLSHDCPFQFLQLLVPRRLSWWGGTGVAAGMMLVLGRQADHRMVGRSHKENHGKEAVW